MRERYDQVSLFQSLLGNLHYLESDLTEAEKSYTRALELDAKKR